MPIAAPRLVCVTHVSGSVGDWQVNGEEVDTQQPVTGEYVAFVLEPSEADAEPFRTDQEARKRPWRHHTLAV